MANLAVNPGMHPYSERADDLYETPGAALLALLAAEPLPRRIWEPAAGRGAIVEVLRAAGDDAVVSDFRGHGDHRSPGIATGINISNPSLRPTSSTASLCAWFGGPPPTEPMNEQVTASRAPYISKRKAALRYDTTPRTIDRWCENPDLGFVERIIINGRVYFSSRNRTPLIDAVPPRSWRVQPRPLCASAADALRALINHAAHKIQRAALAIKSRPQKPLEIRIASRKINGLTMTTAPLYPSQDLARHVLHRDIETRSAASLDRVGAWRYAADPSTEILCVGYAFDDSPVQLWAPGQPIPEPFIEAARNPQWLVVAHNDQFERAIEDRILHPRYGWPLIPIERHRCTMAMALANALPGALDAAAAALELPHRKDLDGHRLMRQMSRPRKPQKDEDPNGIYWLDDEVLRERLCDYCRRDVEEERALFHWVLPLSPGEQEIWALDANINARGFAVDTELAQAIQEVVRKCRIDIDAELAVLTGGAITSAGQAERIKTRLKEAGHTIESLNKSSVAAILAQSPSSEARRLLELRLMGAQAAPQKLNELLAGVDADHRMRGALRYHGAATGRWSGRGFQPQNLKKPKTKNIDEAILAIVAGDMDRLRELGAPLEIAGDLSRSLIVAPPGKILIGGDFSAVESRVTAWLCGERWKLDVYKRFDETNDPRIEPYSVLASQALNRTVTPEDEAGRQFGKIYDLAFGYGGGVSAWRKFDSSDRYSDDEIKQFRDNFRRQHRATVVFWTRIDNAARRTVKTGQRTVCGRIAFERSDTTLFMVLPSGRRLAYPEAHIGPGTFGTPQVHFRDNARGDWKESQAWHGTWIENAVQAISRDLLAAAMLRLEEASFPVVLHVHDEAVCEIPEGTDNLIEFQRLLTALPDWAAGLPIAAKVWTAGRYGKTTKAPPKASRPLAPEKAHPPPNDAPLQAHDRVDAAAAVSRDTRDAPTVVPLADLIGEPLDAHGKIHCPFHDDAEPSLHVYDDHYHCFGCGAHGDQIDWLMRVEGLDYGEALDVLRSWSGPTLEPRQENDDARNLIRALELWEEARPIAGTLAERYLIETRGINAAALPDNLAETLRFHPRSIFGPKMRHPCLIGLFRDVETDAPCGIHRVALTPQGRKIERRMLGRWQRSRAIKLWPADERLVVGEGIETVLAAATHINHRGVPLQPAWALGSSGATACFPVLAGIERLIILVDNDENGVGRADARACATRWRDAGRTAVLLTPRELGTDFNDIVLHHGKTHA
jgi:DNA polymerase